jgi:hypothetical protein
MLSDLPSQCSTQARFEERTAQPRRYETHPTETLHPYPFIGRKLDRGQIHKSEIDPQHRCRLCPSIKLLVAIPVA